MEKIIEWLKNNKAKAIAGVVALIVLLAGGSQFERIKGWFSTASVDILDTRPTPTPEAKVVPTPEMDQMYEIGDRGAGVMKLQQALIAAGCAVQVDGIYGEETAMAVKKCADQFDAHLLYK